MDYKKTKSELETKFNSVKVELEKTQAGMKQLENELMMINGEYRLIDRLEREANKEQPSKEQPKK